MNKITKPKFKNCVAIGKLTRNERLKHHGILSTQTSGLIHAYRVHQRNGGFLLNRPYPALSDKVKEALEYYYDKPPVSHGIINDLRLNDSTSLCPMCGSMHRGTLDHVLPKAIWPEFSLLTGNLVPACKCNQMKNATLGISNNHRMLHPYYDDILEERLIKARFSDLGAVPNISLGITKKTTHPDYLSIKYHVDHVVLKNDILGYLSNRWESFFLFPRLIVREIGPHLRKRTELVHVLTEEIRLLDETHGGKNNWNSVFAVGLLTEEVIDWLLQELRNPDRDRKGKLI